ncbi:hypothetical protein SNK03_006754 [Fusarium graminearum]
MYRSLLLQLLQGFADLQCVLDDPELVPRGQAGCPSLNILKDLLRSAVLKLDQRSFTCYIDALDECDEQQVMDMVEYFEDLAEQCAEDGVRLQICFSSRHYPFVDIRVGLCLILEEQAGHTGDLETYIKSHLRVRDPSLLAELQERMLEKASGVFMWVVLVVEVLNVENRRGRLSLKTRLEEVPSGLSELFKDLLRRDNTNMEELLLSILWILLSERPLKPEEYYHALWSGLSLEGLADVELPAINVADANDCFSRCVVSSSKGLAEITKAKHPTVQFIHESVRDFLIKDKGLHELWPELGADWESFGHDRLKLCCQSYVKFAGTRELPLLQVNTEKSYPFLEYASQFVLHHADRASDVVCQEAFLYHFPTSVWITVTNIFEKFKIREYTQGATLIYILAERGHPGLIRVFLKANPDNLDINRRVHKERYRYPLIAAMAKGDKNSVITLLGLSSTIHDGADIAKTLVCNIDAGGANRNPLSWACEHGHLGIVKVLMSRSSQNNDTRNGMPTPLMLASQKGHIDIAKFLIDYGVDIHKTVKRKNAISLASAEGHAMVVRMLFDAGADLHFSNADGASLLSLAADHINEEVVKFLLGKGLPVNGVDRFGKGPLQYAARRKGSTGVMKELLRQGADVHASDRFGNTCLMRAATNATAEEVTLLIKHGADVTAQYSDGRSCLHMASEYSSEPFGIIQVFLDNGADVNARDNAGRTCLHNIAARRHSLPSLDHLLQILAIHKVDTNASDKRGDTPLHFLSLAHSDNLSPFLNQSNLDLNAQNHIGQTPLHHASDGRRDDLVPMLIEHGADVNSTDNKGRTLLDYARTKEVAQILTTKGGKRGFI